MEKRVTLTMNEIKSMHILQKIVEQQMTASEVISIAQAHFYEHA